MILLRAVPRTFTSKLIEQAHIQLHHFYGCLLSLNRETSKYHSQWLRFLGKHPLHWQSQDHLRGLQKLSSLAGFLSCDAISIYLLLTEEFTNLSNLLAKKKEVIIMPFPWQNQRHFPRYAEVLIHAFMYWPYPI